MSTPTKQNKAKTRDSFSPAQLDAMGFPAPSEELALIYQAKGLPADEAQTLAKRLITDKASALDAMAGEELGIHPDEQHLGSESCHVD